MEEKYNRTYYEELVYRDLEWSIEDALNELHEAGMKDTAYVMREMFIIIESLTQIVLNDNGGKEVFHTIREIMNKTLDK